MGQDLALEFANTAEWHAGPHPDEKLTSYQEAVSWAGRAGILSEPQARRLLARAAAHPTEQVEALGRIVALREAIYHVFSAVAAGRTPVAYDLELLNQELSLALGHLRLVEATEATREDEESTPKGRALRFGWSWVDMEDDLASLLWPVAREATALLTSPELSRLRECADEACGWLFLDQSRNGSRRWCDMADCGNRAKARRFRERKKEDAPKA